MLLAEKSWLISEELEVSIELSDVAFDSLLDISYTNLGIRHPMNCIRSLTINTLAEHYFGDNFDKSKYKIVISSTTEADIKMKTRKGKCDFSA